MKKVLQHEMRSFWLLMQAHAFTHDFTHSQTYIFYESTLYTQIRTIVLAQYMNMYVGISTDYQY